MASLNIAERRLPQDGRFKIKALGKEVDLRVSVLPTVHGEKVVMRVLDKASLQPNLAALGLDDAAAVQAHLHSAHFLAFSQATANWVEQKTVRRYLRTAP
jgi:type II secretory ATPase GspE/PulE/Tfp pilus assembly ATPase PilB-like protein